MAWRVLDAQFFGVAQRRRRVFLVGCLGAGGGASAVLFEPEGVFGDTPSSKEKRQALAADARSRAAGADGRGDCLTPWYVQSKRVNSPDGVCPTLQSGTHENQSIEPLVMASGQANAEICEGGVAPTLTLLHEAPVLAEGPTCSPRSTRRTARSCSSTTNPSTAGGSCSIPDGSGPSDVVCMADDNARAAVDHDLSGSLKVGGGGQPFVAFRPTERTSSGPSAPETTRESGANTSTRARSSWTSAAPNAQPIAIDEVVDG